MRYTTAPVPVADKHPTPSLRHYCRGRKWNNSSTGRPGDGYCTDLSDRQWARDAFQGDQHLPLHQNCPIHITPNQWRAVLWRPFPLPVAKRGADSCSQFSKGSRAGWWVCIGVSACWDFILRLTCAKKAPGPTQWGRPWGRTDFYLNCLVLKDTIKGAVFDFYKSFHFWRGLCDFHGLWLGINSFQCPRWSQNRILFV